jgi:hypothetical protein
MREPRLIDLCASRMILKLEKMVPFFAPFGAIFLETAAERVPQTAPDAPFLLGCYFLMKRKWKKPALCELFGRQQLVTLSDLMGVTNHSRELRLVPRGFRDLSKMAPNFSSF